MTTIAINAKINVPVSASKAQINEWVQFHLGCTNGISCENPLYDEDDFFAQTVSIDETSD